MENIEALAYSGGHEFMGTGESKYWTIRFARVMMAAQLDRDATEDGDWQADKDLAAGYSPFSRQASERLRHNT